MRCDLPYRVPVGPLWPARPIPELVSVKSPDNLGRDELGWFIFKERRREYEYKSAKKAFYQVLREPKKAYEKLSRPAITSKAPLRIT